MHSFGFGLILSVVWLIVSAISFCLLAIVNPKVAAVF